MPLLFVEPRVPPITMAASISITAIRLTRAMAMLLRAVSNAKTAFIYTGRFAAAIGSLSVSTVTMRTSRRRAATYLIPTIATGRRLTRPGHLAIAIWAMKTIPMTRSRTKNWI